METIATNFLQFLNALKIYHWQTSVYSRHKATDTLYKQMSDKMDEFLETMIGSKQHRLRFTNEQISLFNFDDEMDGTKLLHSFQFWLKTDLARFIKDDSDLINLKDEMLGNVNQTLYLFNLA